VKLDEEIARAGRDMDADLGVLSPEAFAAKYGFTAEMVARLRELPSMDEAMRRLGLT